MLLQNIHNNRRDIFLFCRDKEGKQTILKDRNFYPFFYEPDLEGKEVGYDGVKLRKVIVSDPYDIHKYKTPLSYSSDVQFTKNYLIHNIPKLDKTIIKYLFWDIEVLCNELPVYTEPKYTISCITTYNSLSKTIQTWFLKEFKSEREMLESFIKYIKREKPDILLGWNSENFDYPYMYFRWKTLTKGGCFAREISPINDSRKYFRIDDLFYPAGISILDYLQLFKKVYMREQSYALDNVAQKYLKEKPWDRTDFNTLKDEIKLKNINDVKRMVKLEEKNGIIPYFDEIRILTKTLWEDLYFNSYIVESLLFEEAKLKKVVLPNCPKKTFGIESEDTFEGATRECVQTGALFDIGKVDLGSAYPNAIVNFCLDPQNINTNKEGILINNIYWTQNTEALLPSLVRKVLILKNTLKAELAKHDPNSDEGHKAQIKYDAIKAVVNSCFGVMGHSGFRLYSNEVASTITFLVREVLMYVKDKVELEGHKVVYWDTDSMFIDTKENTVDKLNMYVQQWAKEKYGKDSVSIEFDYEGYFNKLFLIAKCRYYGYITKIKKGKEVVAPEIKGVEIKRSSSSKYEADYQKNLLEKFLNKDSQESINKWVKEEKERIKTLPLLQVCFPCKLGNKVYKNVPIFMRAYANTKKIKPSFLVEKGELFYYTFIDNPNSDRSVLAFTEKDSEFLKSERIDWNELIRRNIDSKTQTIYDAMGWFFNINNQLTLF